MAKTSGEFEKEFIQTSKEKTGKSVDQWYPVIKATGLSKQMEITNWLKADHKFNHMQATLLTGLYLNGGQPVYQDEMSLLNNQFAKSEVMRPLFDSISEKIISTFANTQLIPKKMYLSYTATREFAAINIRPDSIRLGIDLGDVPFDDFIQKSKLTGPMPRISHMVILIDPKQMDNKVRKYLQSSYDRSHKK